MSGSLHWHKYFTLVLVNLCVWGRAPNFVECKFENCPPCIRLCNTIFFPQVSELLVCHKNGMFNLSKVFSVFHACFYQSKFTSEGVCFEKACLNKTIASLKGWGGSLDVISLNATQIFQKFLKTSSWNTAKEKIHSYPAPTLLKLCFAEFSLCSSCVQRRIWVLQLTLKTRKFKE